MPRKPRRTLQENYDALVIKKGEDECWGWAGHLDKDGYGLLNDGGYTLTAHRACYELVHGEIPKGLCVLHRCDNPPCSNPAHLFLGTQRDNMLDRNRKGRQVPPKGMLHGAHKLTDEQVLAIRNTQAACRALAAQYGVHHGTIARIKKRINWKHI